MGRQLLSKMLFALYFGVSGIFLSAFVVGVVFNLLIWLFTGLHIAFYSVMLLAMLVGAAITLIAFLSIAFQKET